MNPIVSAAMNLNLADPRVICSHKLPQHDNIVQHITEPYGATLIALSVIDPENREIKFTIEFDTAYELGTFVSELLKSWIEYRPIRTEIRSYRENGQLADMKKKLRLNETKSRDLDPENKGSVVDIDTNGMNYHFKIYHRQEPVREINCVLVKADTQN
jgi:hypothetical protein